MSQKHKEITEMIMTAFESSTLPEGVPIFKVTAARYFDADSQAKKFEGKYWKDISIEVLVRNKDNLPYMTQEAYCFFLPAYLIAAINHPKEVDVLVDSTISSLTPPDPSASYYNDFVQRSACFNRKQIEVFISFFESYTEIYPPDQWSYSAKDQQRVRKAIEFWMKRLSEV